MKQWLLSLAILAVAISGTWYLLQPADEKAPRLPGGRSSNVNVSTPVSGEIEDRLQAVGTTRARNSVTIANEIAGRIVEIKFEEGQRVRQGDILVVLDQRQAQADLEVAQARLKDAEAKYQRAKRLRSSNSIADAELEELETALTVARANSEAARTRLENLQITAPFDGVVGLREVSIGAYLATGTTITTLDSMDQMLVRFDVPQRFLARLHPGQSVNIGAGAGETYRGEVTELGSRIDPQSRSLTVQSRIDNSEGQLRPGQFVDISVIFETRVTLLIPEQAVLTRGRDRFVFIADDGRAKRVPLTLGSRNDGKVEVINGLEADDKVIINGNDGINDGDRLNVLEDDNALLSRGIEADQGKDT